MALQKFLAGLLAILLTLGSATPGFAFPRQERSTIDEAGGWGTGPYRFEGFLGDWTYELGRGSWYNWYGGAKAMAVQEFMRKEFEPYTKGQPQDMKIWNTPSFTQDKVDAETAAWNELKKNPTGVVPASVGLSMYTTHDEMMDFISSLPTDYLTVEYAGEVPRGFPYPVLVFSKSKDRSPAGLNATGKPIVYVQGNIHGGEWSGGEGALAIAYDLARNINNLLDNVNVVMVPRICADGAKYPIRSTADLLALQWTATPDRRDLNRDNLLLDLPVTRINKKLINAYVPHFSVDLHERGPAEIETIFGRTVDIDNGDVGMSGTTILDTPAELTRIRYEELEPVIAKVAEEHKLTMGLYGEGADVYTHGRLTQFADAASWQQDWIDSANNHTISYANTWSADELTKIAPHAGSGYQTPTSTGIDSDGNPAFTTTGYVTNTAYDPDAPYYLITDASFNTRSSRNINSLMGTVSQLFENKCGPSNIGQRGMWDRRVATAYACVLGTVTAAASKSDEFVKRIGDIRAGWIEKGKTVSTDDMIPVLQLTPKPFYWNEGARSDSPAGAQGFKGHDQQYPIVDITDVPTWTGPTAVDDALPYMSRYDATKAMKYVGAGNPGAVLGTKGDAFTMVRDNSGVRATDPNNPQTAAMFKLTRNWLGYPLRERVRPFAYLLEGPYAGDIALRMALNGIEVKRLAEDASIEVEGWSYNQVPYVDNAASGGVGWRNRDVTFVTKTKEFKKDETYVVYLAQLGVHLIPMYLEPDAAYNAAACVMLPYMSLALGGAGSKSLSPQLVGMEMPVYRYLKEEMLPTYDMNVDLPLVDKGAVARFFQFPTQEEVKAISENAAVRQSSIRVYNTDFQVHTRTDAFDGSFDITLPTHKDSKSYMIRTYDRATDSWSYAELPVTSEMLGFNVATITPALHGAAPFTVDLSANGTPVVGDGSNRTLPQALPPADDLYGVQIIEVLNDSVNLDQSSSSDDDDDDDDWSC